MVSFFLHHFVQIIILLPIIVLIDLKNFDVVVALREQTAPKMG
jgi:hypothetical protein